MDAIAAHHAFRARQEVDLEPLRIVRPAQWCLAPPIGLVPGRDWRNPECTVPFSMITGDFQRQPVLQFVERHRRLYHGIVVATVLDAAEGRSRQQVDRPHHRADQTLDVTAVVRRPNRPVLQRNPVLLGAPLHRLRTEFPGIVDVNGLRQSLRGPVRVDPQALQPVEFGLHQVLNGQCHRQGRRRLQRQIESRNHAAGNVDGERQPGPLQRFSMNPVHDNDIHQRVVDLNHLIGPFDLIAAWHRVMALARGLSALTRSGELRRIYRRHTVPQRGPARGTQTPLTAPSAHLLLQGVDARLLEGFVEILDRPRNHRFNLVRQPTAARRCSDLSRQQRTGDRARLVR